MDDFIEGYLDRIEEIINRVGWCVQAVGGDESAPPYAYTIGLTEAFSHPEVFLIGFSPNLSQQMLNAAAAAVKCGQRLDGDMLADGVAEGLPVAIRKLDRKAAARVGKVADARYEERGFEAVQMFLPDPQGHFPWDTECSAKYASIQTSIFGVGQPGTGGPRRH